ncbi:sigma-70 family RNA polymerase sigma factor [Chitinophaga defluvii]|uniref:Sigma-70 family RNA polymerase sigma factor n=1 Tax=Chitinophaga defluvii TaxID=3163343 RepID=A0ABV2TDG9_9BACT
MKDYQHILFPYAYNILGSAEDAKDAIQDVLFNYLAANKTGIENEKNYLIKSVINQSINIRQKRTQVKLGDVWLPEPVATERADTNINLNDIVSYSMLILLEQLNPKERAVFILKESFGYAHEEIGEVLGITVDNSRKLLSRARTRLNEFKQQAPPKNAVPADILNNYIHAIRSRDTGALENLLSKEVTYFADGGKLNVVKKVAIGMSEVAALMLFVDERYGRNLTAVPVEINHQPALLYYNKNKLIVCQVFNISADGKINQISNVLDPEKLKTLQPESLQ